MANGKKKKKKMGRRGKKKKMGMGDRERENRKRRKGKIKYNLYFSIIYLLFERINSRKIGINFRKIEKVVRGRADFEQVVPLKPEARLLCVVEH